MSDFTARVEERSDNIRMQPGRPIFHLQKYAHKPNAAGLPGDPCLLTREAYE